MPVTLAQINDLFTFGGTSRLTPELVKSILDIYSKKEGGPDAIVEILKKPPYNTTFNRSTIQRTIAKAIKAKMVVEVPIKEMKTILAQKIYTADNPREIHNTVREVTERDLITTQKSKTGKVISQAPSWAKYKVVYATPENLETTVIPKKFQGVQYYRTKEAADAALKERVTTSFKPIGDPELSRIKRQRTRAENVRAITKGSSAADKAYIKTIQGGIAKINTYFKNSPELINTTPFGKNIKAMMALRLDKDTSNFYSRLKPDDYYLTKAKQGQLFDLFDINPVAGKKPGGRFATNVNIAPGQFNRAFVGSQLTHFFKKGVNEETASNLDKILKERNIRVDLPNVGKIGAAADVAVDTKTGSFPRIIKTLETMEAPEEIKNLFRSIAELKPGSSSFKKVCTNLKASGGTIDSCLEIVAQDPEAAANKFKNLDVQSGPLAKVKSAANTFLSVAKKGGRFGAFAAVGAAGAGLVKEFMNDDPSTYLSDENQQKNMLIDMITQPVLEPSMEPATTAFGDATLPAIGAVTAAGMVPGGAELYRQRIGSPNRQQGLGGPPKIPKARVSPFRAALGPMSGVLGKGLASTGTPLGMLALEPLYIGQQIADGDSLGEVATNPFNYLGPAFAGSLTKEATRFAGPKMANFMRLGISPMALKTVSRRFGIPGLALSAGISGYEMYQNKKAGRGLFDDG